MSHDSYDVFIVNPAVDLITLRDALSERQSQALALTIVMSSGAGFDFDALSQEIRRNYIWALERCIEDMGRLHHAILRHQAACTLAQEVKS